MSEKTTIYKDGDYVEIDKAFLDLPKETPVFLRAFLYKTDIYSRMTDEELAAFEVGMETADTRTRLMWRDCLQVDVKSTLFNSLHLMLSKILGFDRAQEILSLDAT